MDWIIGLQKAIDYIENNLTDTIDYEKVAAQSYSSSYHFQRVFSILCGFTIGEYIRNRRLSLAGTELATSDAKVIDVALKYGYESPDSFAKAFQKFHGILPSQARNDGSKLKTFSRLVLKFSLEGGTIMNYRIETKPQITLLGYKRHFEGMPYDELRYKQEENSPRVIPKNIAVQPYPIPLGKSHRKKKVMIIPFTACSKNSDNAGTTTFLVA